MTNNKLSSQVQRAIDQIKNSEELRNDSNKLINMYNNFENSFKKQKISEYELEIGTKILEEILREYHPKKSASIFGSKNNYGIGILNEIYQEIEKSINLSDNTLNPGVKAGMASIINENIYVEVYISYKNVKKHGTQLVFTQKKPNSNPFLTVRKYFEAWDKYNEHYESKEYGIDKINEAKIQYEQYLKKIITM